VTSFPDLFERRRPVIGMVHLAPLPGSPRFTSMNDVADRALSDSEILARVGFDGLLVENFGDVPFLPGPVGPETTAALAVVVEQVVRATGRPVGVNVLRNDARAALAVAAATGARFIRVNVHTGAAATDQGIIEGRAFETLRERARLGSDVAILADVLVKHAAPLGLDDPVQVARETAERGLADGLLVTGGSTGEPPDEDLMRAVRTGAPHLPVLVASGLSEKNAPRLFPLSDGAIVGTSLKEGGVETLVSGDKARRLLEALRETE
jgi:membrane complex biogenesis BtpA family protein